MTTHESDRNPIDVLSEEFLERIRRGERPPLSEYVNRRPELADEIRELFPLLMELEGVRSDGSGNNRSLTSPGAARPAAGALLSRLQELGDYRIIREVGRGGMGVVYEAEQVSLGRHVALKVLPAAALPDDKHVRRFEREAKSAARLHHTNIVPVFGVGTEQDLHYYVMQFIQGLPLDEVIDELKTIWDQPSEATGTESRRRDTDKRDLKRPGSAPRSSRLDVTAANVARSLMTGQFSQTLITDSNPDPFTGSGHSADGSGGSDTQTPPPSRTSHPAHSAPPSLQRTAEKPQSSRSDSSSGWLAESLNLSGALSGSSGRHGKSGVHSSPGRPFTYWQSVAHIGVQVADAMQYAHDQGVLHRDIKPSNLLLDLRGTTWVTDFGLAKATDQQDITHTGDILGTLRYMPPEAFEGKADVRGDVYSLGLTLYELLAFRPAFSIKDRHQLIKQVTTDSAPRLDRLNPAIPRDLVTIIHKAIDRDPGHRYQTAAELEADLQRFLHDEPIRARRISPIERFARWSRRNRGLAIALSAVCLLLLVINIAGPLLTWQMSQLNQKLFRTIAALQATQDELRDETEAARQLVREKQELANEMKLSAAQERAARAEADRQRIEAERQKELSRRGFYSSSMLMAGRLLDSPERTVQLPELLSRLKPNAGENDLRGWEWYFANSLTEESRLTLRLHENHPHDVAYSRDGTLAATVGHDHVVQIWDAQSGFVLKSLTPSFDIVWSYVAWLPDGRRVVTCANETICVWDITTGEIEQKLAGHTAQSGRHGLVIAPDGTRVAVIGANNVVRIWDLDSGEITTECQALESLGTVQWSRDGRQIATIGDGPIRLWDAQSGSLLKTIGDVDTNAPSGVWFEEHWLATVQYDTERPEVQIWDLESAECVKSFSGHTGVIWDIAWSPEQRLLATCSDDGTVRIWDPDADPDGEAMAHVLQLTGMQLKFLAFRPGGHELATGDWEHDAVEVWTIDPKRADALAGHDSRMIEFSPDGLQLASADGDGVIRIWDCQTRRVVTVLSDALQSLQGCPWVQHSGNDRNESEQTCCFRGVIRVDPGRTLARAGMRITADGEFILTINGTEVGRGAEGWEEIQTFDLTDVLQSGENVVAIEVTGVRVADESHAGSLIGRYALTYADHTVNTGQIDSAWRSMDEAVDGWQRADFDDSHWEPVTPVAEYGQEPWQEFDGPLGGSIRAIAWHPDGRQLAAADNAGNLCIWDIGAERCPVRFRAHQTGAINAVCWSPDGTRLASAGDDNLIMTWDSDSWEPTTTLRGHLSRVTSLDWSPDDSWIVSVEESGTIRLWEPRTGVEIATLGHFGEQLECVRFSPDGKTFLTAGSKASHDGAFSDLAPGMDGIVRLWDADSQTELLSFRGHARTVTSIDWSPDGSRALSASPDGTLRIWDIASGQELLMLESNVHADFRGARFSPNGVQLAGVSETGTIELWDTLRGHARDLSPRLLPLLDQRITRQAVPSDLVLRGKILARLGQWDAAGKDFQRATQDGSTNVPGWFLSPWWVVGPYAENLTHTAPPEQQVDPLRPVPAAKNGSAADAASQQDVQHWLPVVTSEDEGLNLGRFLHQVDHASAYAQLRIYSPIEQPVGLLFGADDTLRLWFNGQLVHTRATARTAVRDDEAVEVTLRSGWNTLLAKVGNNTQDHGLFLRLSNDPAQLARVFERMDHWEQAVAHWTRAASRTPENAQLHYSRGRAAILAGDDATAAEALSAAAHQASDPVSAWQKIAELYQSTNRPAEAIEAQAERTAALEELAAENPDDTALRERMVAAQADLIIARIAEGQRRWQATQLVEALHVWDAATETMEKLRAQTPYPESQIQRVAQANKDAVCLLVQHGMWELAAEQVEKLGNGELGTDAGVYISATLHLFAGNAELYRETCQRLLEEHADSTQPEHTERVAKLSLTPATVTDPEPYARMADRTVEGRESHPLYFWYQLAKGLAEYRRGHHEAVIEWLVTNRKQHDTPVLHASEDLLVAMAYHHLDAPEQAQRWLDQARERSAQLPLLGTGTLPSETYALSDQIRMELLRREAEMLIEGHSSDADYSNTNPQTRRNRALVFARIGRVDDALTELQAVQLPAQASLRNQAIRARVMAQADWAEAEAALNSVAEQLAQHPEPPDDRHVTLWQMVAEGYSASGQPREAAWACRNAAAIVALAVSDSKKPSGEQLSRLDRLYDQLVSIHISADQTVQAEAAANEADQLRTALSIADPLRPRPSGDPDVLRDRALAAVTFVIEQSIPGPVQKDMVRTRWRARLLHRHGELSYQAGDARQGRQDLEQARSLLEQVLAVQPSDTNCAEELAEILRRSFGGWSVAKPVRVESRNGTLLNIQSDGSVLASGRNPDQEMYTVELSPELPFATGLQLELLPDPSLPHGNSGRFPTNGNCTISEVRMSVIDADSQTETPVIWRSAVSPHRVEPEQHYERRDIHAGNLIDNNPETYWETWPISRSPLSVTLLPRDRIDTTAGNRLIVRLLMASPEAQHNVGRFRLALTNSPTPEATDEPASTSPWVRLAVAYAALGEPQLAATHFARALDTSTSIEESRAIVERAGAWQDVFQKLARQRPQNAFVQIALTRGAHSSGTPEAAAAARQRARELLEQQIAEHLEAGDQPAAEKHADLLAELLLDDSSDRLQWSVLDVTDMSSVGGATFTELDDQSVLVDGADRTNDVYTLRAPMDIAPVTAIRLEVLPHPSLPNHGPGRHPTGNFHLSSFRVLTSRPRSTPVPVPLSAAWASYQWESPLIDIHGTIDEGDARRWHVWGELSRPHHAVFIPAAPIQSAPKQMLTIELHHGGDNAGHNLGRFRLSVSDSSDALRREWAATMTNPWQKLAMAYSTAGAPDQATRFLVRALESASDFETRTQLIETCLAFGMDFEALVALQPESPQLHAALARQQMAAGNPERAADALVEARRLAEIKLEARPEDRQLSGLLTELLLKQFEQDAEQWSVLSPTQMVSDGGATLTRLEDESVLASGLNPDGDSYTIRLRPERGIEVAAIRLEALPDPSLPGYGPGRDEERDLGAFHITGLDVSLRSGEAVPTPLRLRDAVANVVHPQVSVTVDRWHSGGNGGRQRGKPHVAHYLLAEPVTLPPDGSLQFRIHFAKTPDWPRQNLGRFRISVTDDPAAYRRERLRVAAQRLDDVHMKLAAAYGAAGDTRRFQELLKRATSPNLEDPQLLIQRAESFTLLDSWNLAASSYAAAIDKLPAELNRWSERSRVLSRIMQQEPLYEAFRRLRPEDPHIGLMRARQLARQGQFAEAAEAAAPAIAHLGPGDEAWTTVAALQLLNGNRTRYQELIERMHAQTPEPEGSWENYIQARAASLSEQSAEITARAVRQAQAAVQEDPRPWYVNTLALTLYRAQRYEEARAAFAQVDGEQWGLPTEPLNKLPLAMIAIRQNQLQTAQELLNDTDRWFDDQLPSAHLAGVNIPPPDWVQANLLRREAQSLFDAAIRSADSNAEAGTD